MNTLRVFTTFSGYDSQCLALDRLGIDYELVGWSEIDRYAIQAHNALYPQWADRNYGDITTIDWAKVPDFDLFTYSSPCQDFSQAGLQRGGEQGSGTRSSLLWECERAIAAKRPKYLLMENVAALVSQKFIKLFNRWQVVLQGYGYKSFPQVLNAKDYGVPQNRERIFLVSILDEEARYEFPKKEKLTRRLKDVLETEVDERYYLNDERVRGLLLSTQKEKDAGRGFAFEPKAGDDTANSVTGNAGSRKTDNFIAEPQPTICAMRGREPEVLTPKRTDYGKTIRKDYEQGKIDEQRKNIQQLEPRTDGVSNTLTSVQKDNLVIEPTDLVRIPTNTKEGEQTMELGGVADLSYPTSKTRRGRVQEGGTVAPTLTCGCESALRRIEPAKCNVVAMLPDERLHDSARRIYDTDGLAPTQNTQLGGNHETKIIEAINTDSDGNATTLTTAHHYSGNIIDPKRGQKEMGVKETTNSGFRIRKLTPRECFRLMDVSDTDIDKIQAAGISNSQQNKLAGNSIVVAVLEKIFYKLFINTEQENEQLKLF